MRILLDRVADDAHRYAEGEIDWAEFGTTVRVFGELLRQAGEFLEQPRKRTLQLIAAEERGEDEWDPLAPLEALVEELEHSKSLEEAVDSVTECAREAGRLDLVRPTAEWSALIVTPSLRANAVRPDPILAMSTEPSLVRRRFYRLVSDADPPLDDFLSYAAQGRTWPDPDLQERAEDVSVWDSIAAVVRLARKKPQLRHVAVLEIPPEIELRRGRHGHWGIPNSVSAEQIRSWVKEVLPVLYVEET